ncbi:hypothetical protein BD779DRAFT_1705914 [Infundibulicybe gibba]|nr:hypothetical protein BD779DRAFT_1705914 [Infundibulicybe gibba]
MKFLSLSLALLLSTIASARLSVIAGPIARAEYTIAPTKYTIPIQYTIAPVDPFLMDAPSVITNTRSSILKAWEDKRNSNKLSGQEKLKALTNDFVKTPVTADKFVEAVPDTNIIVVLGKHQFSYVEDVYQYDELVVIDEHYLKYTVILFHVGKFTLESDEQPQGSSRGLVFGLCAPDKERKDQWTCRKAKAKGGQKKS